MACRNLWQLVCCEENQTEQKNGLLVARFFFVVFSTLATCVAAIEWVPEGEDMLQTATATQLDWQCNRVAATLVCTTKLLVWSR